MVICDLVWYLLYGMSGDRQFPFYGASLCSCHFLYTDNLKACVVLGCTCWYAQTFFYLPFLPSISLLRSKFVYICHFLYTNSLKAYLMLGCICWYVQTLISLSFLPLFSCVLIRRIILYGNMVRALGVLHLNCPFIVLFIGLSFRLRPAACTMATIYLGISWLLIVIALLVSGEKKA